MLENNNKSPLRCPKCNEPMRLLADHRTLHSSLAWRNISVPMPELCRDVPARKGRSAAGIDH